MLTAAFLLAGAATAHAQFMPFSGPASPPPLPPSNNQAQPAVRPAPNTAHARATLALNARYAADGPYVQRSLHWRIFTERPGNNGPLTLVAESGDAAPSFLLAPGKYVVHVAYGLASFAQRIDLRDSKRETVIVAAGGLRLRGQVGDTQIPTGKLRFDVYEGTFLQRGPVGGKKKGVARSERPPVVRGVAAGDLVLLPAGTYYVQSTYGEGNSTIQADIRIEPGRLTDATVHHRAAQITLRLVHATGGEALANTSWSVLTPGGDSIKEFIGAFPSIVLADGEYVAVARHDGKTYQTTFKVASGRDREVEVLARAENQQATRP